MKSFRSLAWQIQQWRRGQLQGMLRRLNEILEREEKQSKPDQRGAKVQIWRYLSLLNPGRLTAIALRPNPFRRKATKLGAPTPIILLIAVISLTSTIGHRFYNEPQLAVGTIAPQTLRAPETTRVEDTKTTEANRTTARTGAIPILMVDQAVNQEIYQSLQRLLDHGSELRQQAGAFPFLASTTLSIGTQQFLRQAQEQAWRSILTTVESEASSSRLHLQEHSSKDATDPANTLSLHPAIGSRSGNVRLDRTNTAQELAILELQSYRRTISAEEFSALRDVIVHARQRYAAAVSSLVAAAANDPDNVYDTTLLSLSDTDWADTKTAVRQALERILGQGIAPGLPDLLIENAVRSQVIDAPPTGESMAIAILTTVLKPNLAQDPDQTRLRAEQAAQAVEPVFVEIRRGEAIVQAGSQITQSEFVLLDHFGLSRREINGWGLFGFTLLVSGALAVYLKVEQRFHPGLRRRDHILVLLLTLSTPLMVIVNLPTISLPAIGLLVGSFYGSALGITVVGLLSLVLPIGMQVGSSAMIANVVGSLVGALLAGQRRSREELALLGGVVGFTQGILYLLLSLLLNTPTSPVWYGVITAAAIQGLLGVAWSVVALGISPYLENLFDLVTPIRLAELSNPNRPLLKQLAAKTPGTFQHTLFVATLAEAAARALGCNVELVRAGTLYHDIGKMHDPLGFIENQMGDPNKHDLIDDPWKSADIIKKHVSEGLVMARKYRLPRAIRAFIPEHQGTMFIAYFYHQAQQQQQQYPERVVRDQDFRYDGPIPQSRETGIVMLADSCEAALRSLKDATPEEALAMVNRILRARWQDQQMTDSGLTRAEMSRIAEIFVRVWQQFNHQRIPYPKLAAVPQPSVAQL